MTDRRLTPFNGRVAHVSLRGHVAAERFAEGVSQKVCIPVADVLAAPGGGRDRQLLHGDGFCALDRQGALVFGFAETDGYVGWMAADALMGAQDIPATHRVAASFSYGKSTPGLKPMGQITQLSLGTGLMVLDETDGWARVVWSRGTKAQDLFVPVQHLAPIDLAEQDAVAVAERLVGTPYLWGGDSSFGIDCSGLVQIALQACGKACPRDSDMQEALGTGLPFGTPPQRGDLMFWKGHVAWVSDPETFLHANAHAMAVAYEPIKGAVARIEKQGDGPVIRHARLT